VSRSGAVAVLVNSRSVLRACRGFGASSGIDYGLVVRMNQDAGRGAVKLATKSYKECQDDL